MNTAASFIEDQKAYFQEAIEHWQRFAALGLPDCDDTNDEEGNGQMIWKLEHKDWVVDLTLSDQMQWIITAAPRNTISPKSEEYVFDAPDDDMACLKQLQKLLHRKTVKRKR